MQRCIETIYPLWRLSRVIVMRKYGLRPSIIVTPCCVGIRVYTGEITITNAVNRAVKLIMVKILKTRFFFPKCSIQNNMTFSRYCLTVVCRVAQNYW